MVSSCFLTIHRCSQCILVQSEIGHLILDIFHFREMYICKQRETFVQCLVTCLRKSTSGLGLLIFFFFIHIFFYKVIKNIIYCQTVHIFGSFTSLSSFLLLATFCLDQCHCLFSSASLSLVGDNLLVHELRVMATVELHLNETYDQHVALKSVNEKSQYKMRGKLFSSRTLFELAQGL